MELVLGVTPSRLEVTMKEAGLGFHSWRRLGGIVAAVLDADSCSDVDFTSGSGSV